MDKTFNDLMSIVSRTKKIDESEGKTSRRVRRIVEPEEEVVEREEVIETKPKKVAKKGTSLFDGAEAINKLVSSPKKKSTKSTEKKDTKKTTAKKETKKETKKEPAKKTTTKKSADKLSTLASNLKKSEKKETPKTNPAQTSNIDMSDPKNAQLYEALHSSLFSQGTDISQYLENDEGNSEQKNQLEELKKQREAMKISQEISREQQEYEQLFTGGFMGGGEEEPVEEETIEARESLSKDRLSNIQALPKQAPRPAPRPKQKSDDIDKKIADYYRRKQEMIDKFNKEQYADVQQENEEQLSSYEKRQSEYEDVFNSSVYNTQPQQQEVEEIEQPSLEENLENIEGYENAEILEEQDEVEEKREMVFEDYDEDEDSTRRISNFRFPTNSEFEDIDSEYALIKRGAINDNVINYNEEDLEIRNNRINNEENIQDNTQIPNVDNNEIQEENVQENLVDSVDEESSQESTNVEDEEIEEVVDTEENANEMSEILETQTSENIEEIPADENSDITERAEEVVEENNQEPISNGEETIEEIDTIENIQENNEELLQNENMEDNNQVEESVAEENNNDETSEESNTQEFNQVENNEQVEVENDKNATSEIGMLDNSDTQDEVVEEKDNEYDNSLINEYSEEVKDENYDMTSGDVNDYIITSNTPVEEERITSETSIFNQDVVYEEDEINPTAENTQDEVIEENSQETTEETNQEGLEEIQESAQENTNLVEENQLAEEMPSSENEESVEDNENIENDILEEVDVEETQSESSEEDYEGMSDDEDISEYIEEVEDGEKVEVITTEDVNDQLSDARLNDIEGEDNSQVIGAPYDDDDDDNTMVIDGDKFVSELSLFPEVEVEEDVDGEDDAEVEETVEEVEEKDSDTISKEEFYNEMARLQENLLNELKGQKVESNSIDYFKDEDIEKKISDDFDEYITFDNTNGEEIPANTNEENKDGVEENSPESKLAEEIIQNWKIREGLIEKFESNSEDEENNEESEEKIEEEKANEDAVIIASEIENGMNLLQLETPLGEDDLKYQEESEKEKEIVKDNYFYLSEEDTEKKAIQDDDEYVKMYNEEITGIYEVGDINLNKDIMNAVPYSKVDTEDEKRMKKEKEIELIYTLFGMEKKEVSKEKEDLKVLYVAGECQPFIATGGLADVAGSLPKAIAEKGGVDIRVILPLYGNIKKDFRDKFEYIGNFTVHLSWRQEYCGLFRYYSDGVTYYFIDNERYFKRDKTFGYYDDGERFAYFSKAIVECLPYINFFPDIIHCNDWHSALVSTYIKTGNWSDFRYYKIKHIYTIHNVEYQGVYGMENLKDLFGIDPRFRQDLDYNGDINLTKAAIQYSDRFTTVSNSYCDNLKQPYCSRGLHHIIIRNEYKLSGIVNGLDYEFYNPETDKVIYKNYSVNTMQDKVMNKKVWQDELGLPVDGDTPMLSIVSRLVSHKGLDLIIKMIENILQKDVQLVVVGTGDQKFVDYFKYLEEKYPTKVRAMVDKYSNDLARKAYAASDIFLMPSKVEPCGISQMIASRYGAIPVVREVGGLKDTITDFGCAEGGNGYTFTNYNPSDLEYQVNRAIVDYADKEGWKKKMEICMTTDFTWAKSADKYIELYNSIVK